MGSHTTLAVCTNDEAAAALIERVEADGGGNRHLIAPEYNDGTLWLSADDSGHPDRTPGAIAIFLHAGRGYYHERTWGRDEDEDWADRLREVQEWCHVHGFVTVRLYTKCS